MESAASSPPAGAAPVTPPSSAASTTPPAMDTMGGAQQGQQQQQTQQQQQQQQPPVISAASPGISIPLASPEAGAGSASLGETVTSAGAGNTPILTLEMLKTLAGNNALPLDVMSAMAATVKREKELQERSAAVERQLEELRQQEQARAAAAEKERVDKERAELESQMVEFGKVAGAGKRISPEFTSKFANAFTGNGVSQEQREMLSQFIAAANSATAENTRNANDAFTREVAAKEAHRQAVEAQQRARFVGDMANCLSAGAMPPVAGSSSSSSTAGTIVVNGSGQIMANAGLRPSDHGQPAAKRERTSVWESADEVDASSEAAAAVQTISAEDPKSHFFTSHDTQPVFSKKMEVKMRSGEPWEKIISNARISGHLPAEDAHMAFEQTSDWVNRWTNHYNSSRAQAVQIMANASRHGFANVDFATIAPPLARHAVTDILPSVGRAIQRGTAAEIGVSSVTLPAALFV